MATISEYKVIKDFNAPKINLGENEMQTYRMHRVGITVSGYIDKSTGKELVVIENEYVIPVSALQFVRDIEIDGRPVNPNPDATSKTQGEKLSVEDKIKEAASQAVKSREKVDMPPEYKAQMEKIKNTNIVASIVNKSRNSVNGMLIGAVVGLVGAIVLKQGKFLGIIVGATAGGFIGYNVSGDAKKKQADLKKEEVKQPVVKETKEKESDGKKD